jgi:hypothetical protein
MTDFKELLRAIDARLDLPQPARSRVLLEIASDLRDLEAHFLEQGLPAEEARRRAADRCDLSEASIRELVRVHGSPYRRFMDRLGAQARTRWERALFAVLLLLVAATLGPPVIGGGMFRAAGLWAWVVLGLGACAAVVGLTKLHAVYLRQAHDPRRLRGGLNAIVALGGTSLAVGILGANVALFRAARAGASHPDHLLPAIVTSLRSGSALLVIAFLSATLCALFWFPLAGRVARIEEAEAALLFLE